MRVIDIVETVVAVLFGFTVVLGVAAVVGGLALWLHITANGANPFQ